MCCVCVCDVWAHTCADENACEGRVRHQQLLHSHSTSCALQHAQLSPKHVNLTRPAGQLHWGFPVSAPQVLGLWTGHQRPSGIYVGPGDPNSSLHTCMPGAIPARPAHQSLSLPPFWKHCINSEHRNRARRGGSSDGCTAKDCINISVNHFHRFYILDTKNYSMAVMGKVNSLLAR